MSQTPSPVVLQWLPILRDCLGSRRDALDLAMGPGRHARTAACHGFRVFGVDRDLNRVRLARIGRLEHARLWIADLETATLPRDRDTRYHPGRAGGASYADQLTGPRVRRLKRRVLPARLCRHRLSC